jgi:hypothetical protein
MNEQRGRDKRKDRKMKERGREGRATETPEGQAGETWSGPGREAKDRSCPVMTHFVG